MQAKRILWMIVAALFLLGTPLMSVAGDHAKNDMSGDEPDSWKSILTEKGFKVEPVLRGTAEIPQIVDVWLDHLKSALSHF